MSHFSVYKTKLGNVSAQLLKQAIQSFAKQIGAEVSASVKDYYGNTQAVQIGLTMPSLPMGIGFGVDNQGNLSVQGDSYGCSQEWNRVSTLATNYIKAYKVAQTARIAHPTAQLNMKTTEKAVILEVCM
uniref:Uncharacterized protein n=1 Tax=viral metagenome TaxID=1070528 RepID=A0A6M3X5S3_9ZZZZ